MIDLSTEYLGIKLEHPLVPSASPLSRHLDTAKQLEDAGASAIVLHSLFEEAMRGEVEQYLRFLQHQGIGFAEAETFLPLAPNYTTTLDDYLEHLARLKRELGIPVIASLNGVTPGGWLEHGAALQEAGANALELNVYYIAAQARETSEDVEQRYLDILRELRRVVSIPVTLKLSSQFSSLVNFVKRLEAEGADGVALFNRFYQPDIDLDTLKVTPRIHLSSSYESLLRIRWVAILRDQVKLSLAVTGGIHTAQDALKALLAGSDVTHMCSALLRHGPEHLTRVLADMRAWLEEKEYESIAQLKGSVSRGKAINPAAYERANYLEVLDSYTTFQV